MSLSQIVDQLLVEVKQESESSSGLSDELLSALQAVFGSPLLHALAILEVEDSVILYTCPAGRSVYQVSILAFSLLYITRVPTCSRCVAVPVVRGTNVSPRQTTAAVPLSSTMLFCDKIVYFASTS